MVYTITTKGCLGTLYPNLIYIYDTELDGLPYLYADI